MILSAHQPAYIPWAGYIHKIISSDVFIILDNVQYEKNSFINRNYLLMNNEPKLLTVPVELKSHISTKIIDIKIANNQKWARKHLQSIQLNYNKTPFYNKHIQFFEKIFYQEWIYINDLNNKILEYFLLELKCNTIIKKMSETSIKGKKTDLIINLCNEFNCDVFILGVNGKNYINNTLGKKNNISFLVQEFDSEKYNNYLKKKLDKNLSVLDILFNMPSENISEYILSHGNLLESH
tara:strand:+ start:2477 stop:3187 length:711 start_codon:yes stop_codon:yes gene_type:complete